MNYTYGHSLDDASGLQGSGGYAGAAFIENPILQSASYANSSFDIRHVVNALAVWQMPFGKGKALMNTENKALDAIVGGWLLSGIYCWNTGLPVTSPYDRRPLGDELERADQSDSLEPNRSLPGSHGDA